jgi:U3 small nucleolar RNA-associated protein 18
VTWLLFPQTKIRMARDLEQGNMKHFVMSPAGDLIAFLGRFGHVHFLNARTKEKAFSLKMDSNVSAVAFSPDGSQLYSHGGKLLIDTGVIN